VADKMMIGFYLIMFGILAVIFSSYNLLKKLRSKILERRQLAKIKNWNARKEVNEWLEKVD
jgi:hypothetical protein